MKPFNEKEQRTTNMGLNDIGFHGDVTLTMTILPDDWDEMVKVKDDCLAYGEATGHMHKLFGDFELREHPKTKDKYFKVGNVCYLKHQEHAPIELKEGVYKVGIQREYDHFDELIREVAD